MRSVLRTYSEIGLSMQANLNRRHQRTLRGVKPFIYASPGRLQYYTFESHPFIPESIKWQIRFPTRYARRDLSEFKYEEVVQDKLLEFLKEKVPHDYIEGNREITLDLSMKEVERLYNADQKLRDMAETGELQALHARCTELTNSIGSGYIKVFNSLDRTMQAICEAEQEVYDQLAENSGFDNLLSHASEVSFKDAMAFVDGNVPLENYSLVKAKADKTSDAYANVVVAERQLRNLLGARAEAMRFKLMVQDEILSKVEPSEHSATRHELREYIRSVEEYEAAFNSEEAPSGEAATFMTQLHEIRNGDMEQFIADCDEYASKTANRDSLYENEFGEDLAGKFSENFRFDVLKHLAGTIIVKEHKIRYQKEQFDRLYATMNHPPLKGEQTLRDFCRNYAELMDILIQSSHNFRCPKIEANYDEYQESTITPISATIFYYFFNSNRKGKTWAQWMLSTVRYPNDRMRRAYMRFFA